MTTLTASPVRASGTTFGNVVRSEWTKLRSLRSTWWSVLAAFGVTLALSLLIDWAIVANWDQAPADQKATFDPTNQAFAGLILGQLGLAVLGVLTVSAEYSTGAVRTTFQAVPRRLSVLAAKAVVMAVVGLVVGLVTSFIVWYASQAIYSTRDIDASIGDPHVLRAVIGAGLYIAACGMFGLALGTLLRSTPGGITGLVALLFLLPLLANAIPGTVGDRITEFFTSNAGSAITTTRAQPHVLGPWTGFLVFALEWGAVLVVGALLVQRRDA